MKLKRVGAEVILSVIIAPFLLWVTTAIFNLQASSGVDQVKVEQIKSLLEKQEKILEKQDRKIDNITNILINRE